MRYVHRNIDQKLAEWKNKFSRKPLILRGARQVGKTTLIDNFSEKYSQYLYFNLESPNDRSIFEDFEDIHDLVPALFLERNIDARENSETLLFIDEVQESSNAIRQLRYFYEEYPNLHIVAAGSLLERSLEKSKGFPVGRVEYLQLHPMNFREYLTALNEENALRTLNTIPFPNYGLKKLKKFFHRFALIGGMPEIVTKYAERSEVEAVQTLFESLLHSFSEDIAKYARNRKEEKIINHIIRTAPSEADSRIKYHGFGKSNYGSREVKEALQSLEAARILQIIHPTTALKPPAAASLKKSPRLQLLDTGLMNYSLQNQSELLNIDDLNKIFRGTIAQHLVIQEYQSIHHGPTFKPVFWVREKKGSSAEIDLIHQHNELLIPIEVKSGKQGRLRSLHEFMDRCDHPYAVRLYAGEVSIDQLKTIRGENPFYLLNLPYFLSSKIPEYIEWFIEEMG